MKLVPLQDRVIVRRDEAEVVSKGGVHLPESTKKRPHRGKVLAVGPGNERPLTIKEGDRVLYAPFTGMEVEVEGETYMVLKEEEILAVVK